MPSEQQTLQSGRMPPVTIEAPPGTFLFPASHFGSVMHRQATPRSRHVNCYVVGMWFSMVIVTRNPFHSTLWRSNHLDTTFTCPFCDVEGVSGETLQVCDIYSTLQNNANIRLPLDANERSPRTQGRDQGLIGKVSNSAAL